MIHIRIMSEQDFSFATCLTDTKNWGLTGEDFKFMIDLEPSGCFIILDDEERVGMATTITFGEIGWIGNVIVEENYRNRGVGSALVGHAIKYLRERSVKTISLYSYMHSVPFYRSLGFELDGKLVAMSGRGVPKQTSRHPRRTEEGDLPNIFALDRNCFGASRDRLLKNLFLEGRGFGFVLYDDNELSGFVFARRYSEMAELGPMVSRSDTKNVAVSLLYTILGELMGLEVNIYVPEGGRSLFSELQALGFAERFKAVRMSWGKPAPFRGCILAAESLERG